MAGLRARTGYLRRRTAAVSMLTALLLLCFGMPCSAAQPAQPAHAAMHDCDAPGKSQPLHDGPAKCLLGYSIPSIAPTGAAARIAYIEQHELLLADAAHESAIVEPPLPPPRSV
jgi:hypothetical protein